MTSACATDLKTELTLTLTLRTMEALQSKCERLESFCFLLPCLSGSKIFHTYFVMAISWPNLIAKPCLIISILFLSLLIKLNAHTNILVAKLHVRYKKQDFRVLTI